VLSNLQGVLEYLLSVAADTPLPPCGGARPRLARSEGGEPQAQKLERTPLPTLPHKGGGVSVSSTGQSNDFHSSGKVRR
jgi:hypothetical protein